MKILFKYRVIVARCMFKVQDRTEKIPSNHDHSPSPLINCFDLGKDIFIQLKEKV